MYHQFPPDFEDRFKHQAERRRELAGRTLGSDPVSAVISLLWMVLIVMPLKLVRGLAGLLVKARGARVRP
jgi:hypothetical protein